MDDKKKLPPTRKPRPAARYIYSWGGGRAEGNGAMRDLLVALIAQDGNAVDLSDVHRAADGVGADVARSRVHAMPALE